MFRWFRSEKIRFKQPTLEEDLAQMRRALEQQGLPEEAIEQVCNQFRAEIEARAAQQRQGKKEQGAGEGT